MLGAIEGGTAEHAETEQCDGGTDAEWSNEAQQLTHAAGHSQHHLQQRCTDDRALDLQANNQCVSEPVFWLMYLLSTLKEELSMTYNVSLN